MVNAFSNDSDSEDELPPSWEERVTLDGSVFYVNHFTQGTQWVHPRTGRKKVVSGDLPPGWEKQVSADGKILYVDNINNTTTYTDPRLAFATEYSENSQPIRPRFDGSSTALSVLHGRDLRKKVAIVTGANTGIGFETARSLALHGCKVIFACRNVEKTEQAINKLQAERDDVDCDILEIDLASLSSVKLAAEKFNQKYGSLNILILNAGVFAVPYSLTEDNYETTFQVNHLSQFYFTSLLKTSLQKCPGSRVVIVSSESHRFSFLRTVEDLNPSNLSIPAYKYWSIAAYNDSKLCNILFAQELAKRWENVGVFCCHPGNLVSSDLSRYSWIFWILFAIVRPFTKSLQQAASTTIYCATAPELEKSTGLYFNNCFHCNPSSPASNPEMAARLWSVSEEMISTALKKTKSE